MSGTTGKKADAGKAPIIQGCLHYFPRALAAVSRCSEYGKKKYNTSYNERNFLFVEDGFGRYTDGLGRHLAGEAKDEGGIDKESGLPHSYMVAWNALARLEVDLALAERPTREEIMHKLHDLDQQLNLNQSIPDDKDISG